MNRKTGLFNTFINIYTEDDYRNIISSAIRTNSKIVVYYLNSHSFLKAEKSQKFQNAFNSASYINPDGYSIVWALKFLHSKEITKITFTHSFINSIRKFLSENHFKVYCLGSSKEVIRDAAMELENSDSPVNVVGYNDGYFNPGIQSGKIIREINSGKAQILFVGMGLPRSEMWINEYKDKIDAQVIITVGNLFDILAGKSKVAPEKIRATPFEWVYRLIHEPVRLIKRYIVCQPYFVYRVFRYKIFKR